MENVCVWREGGGVIDFTAMKYYYAMYTIYFLILHKYAPNSAAIFYHCTDVHSGIDLEFAHAIYTTNVFFLVH